MQKTNTPYTGNPFKTKDNLDTFITSCDMKQDNNRPTKLRNTRILFLKQKRNEATF